MATCSSASCTSFLRLDPSAKPNWRCNYWGTQTLTHHCQVELLPIIIYLYQNQTVYTSESRFENVII
jgi:hypothetical protein